MSAGSPVTIAGVEVVPVAGHDSMLLNLSGAHGPWFTRNIALVTDSEGRTGRAHVETHHDAATSADELAASYLRLLVGRRQR